MSDEIKPELIEKTQKILGKHISKPVLSEKLLKKPPFRFLHDVVTAVVKDTGFLKGLFTENELISDNVKERDLKVAFLTKLIDAVKTVTQIDLKAKPTKIIAGLEPSETNKLLQALGFALDKRIDSTEYVKKVNSKSKVVEKAKRPSKINTKDNKSKDSVRERKQETESTKSDKSKSKGESSNRDIKNQEKNKKKSKKDVDKRDVTPKIETPVKKEEIKDTLKGIDANKIIEHEEKVTENLLQQDKDENKEVGINMEDAKEQLTQESEHVQHNQKKIRSDRPKSARPQSGDFKKGLVNKLDKLEEHTLSPQKENVVVRPMSSLRPPSVRPSSARPGAPRLRPDSALPLQEMIPLGKIDVIVEDYNAKDLDEEETVIIQNVEIDPEPVQQILNIPEDKGHLVEQILEQIHDDDVVEHIKVKNEIDWENEGFRNRDTTNREINQLRSQIQSLTKVANPLGKLMNYLHEDVESMLSELNMWMNMKKDMNREISKQKKINEESSKPLMFHLQELENQIKKQEAEIVNIRSNILRNELRIKDFLTK